MTLRSTPPGFMPVVSSRRSRFALQIRRAGESGSGLGKHLIGKLLHRQSAHRRRRCRAELRAALTGWPEPRRPGRRKSAGECGFVRRSARRLGPAARTQAPRACCRPCHRRAPGAERQASAIWRRRLRAWPRPAGYRRKGRACAARLRRAARGRFRRRDFAQQAHRTAPGRSSESPSAAFGSARSSPSPLQLASHCGQTDGRSFRALGTAARAGTGV